MAEPTFVGDAGLMGDDLRDLIAVAQKVDHLRHWNGDLVHRLADALEASTGAARDAIERADRETALADRLVAEAARLREDLHNMQAEVERLAAGILALADLTDDVDVAEWIRDLAAREATADTDPVGVPEGGPWMEPDQRPTSQDLADTEEEMRRGEA